MSGYLRRVRTPIRVTVVAGFLLATALTAFLAIGLQYYFGQAAARQTAAELYTATSAGIAARLENIRSVNDVIMALLAGSPDLTRVYAPELKRGYVPLLCFRVSATPMC